MDLTGVRKEKVREYIENPHVQDPLWGFLWFVIGLPVLLLVSSYLSWGAVDIHPDALPMVSLAGVAYIGLLASRYQTYDHLSYRAIGMSTFYTTLAYAVILAFLAMCRCYYSRTFLLTGYGITVFWMTTGVVLFGKSHPRYLVIKGGIAKELRKFQRWGWAFREKYPRAENLSQYEGVVVDLHAHEKDAKLIQAMAWSSLQGVPIIHAATVLENYSGHTNLDYIAEEGLYALNAHRFYPILKRILELGVMIVTSPLILILGALTALTIKCESRGPVLFTQERVGKGGKLFTLYKFRSMTTAAEDEGAQFAGEQDHRVTMVGRLIRKIRLDEIPQFWNVLKGNMSLIGPRPEQETFVEYFNEDIPFYSYRHKIRPGITGWAQIKDGYADDLESTKTKLEYDLYYIKNLSLSFDLLIIYATVKTILTGFGAR